MTKHHQTSLFANDTDAAVSVVSALGQQKPADKAQAAFQRLLRQVDEQRNLLSAWTTYGTRYHQRLGSELLPIYDAFRATRRDIALLLDKYWEKNVLRGKAQRTKLHILLLDLLDTLLEEGPDKELEALYTKHANTSFADEKAAEAAQAKSILENVLGIPLDDFDGTGDLADMLRHAEKKMAGHSGRSGNPPEQNKRKTAKQEAAELKKEEAAKKVSQTVRDVYRKLASALHPDRESDPVAREQKTGQMQRVNQAYQAGDLLTLLNLQFEIEQIDTAHLASLSGERLTHYNQVLREQLAELKAEVEALTAPFKEHFEWQRNFTPQDVDRKMSADIISAQRDLKEIREDLERLQNPAELKPFIEEMQIEPEFADDSLLNIFLDSIAPPPPRQKRGKRKTAGHR
ncbi:MAG: hypothetical protein CVU16_04940 [Betaproteobacteria bacterium HGW-Betaproteobacteria-10]|nr:MAG: hypothetical protein CVU16_04940 [Betaproteobacteria bacterium HGW-Betaproteobacteria-10]